MSESVALWIGSGIGLALLVLAYFRLGLGAQREETQAPPAQADSVPPTRKCGGCHGTGKFQGQNWNITCGVCRGTGRKPA